MAKRKSEFRIILRDFISLFFPDYCLGCSNTLVKGENMICTRCMLQIPQTNYHLNPDNPLFLRFVGRIQIRNAFGLFKFTKQGRIQQILHALKYKNQPEAGIALGKVYGQKLKNSNYTFDLIVPIPLHTTRLRKRGYNQSAKFAEGLGEIMGIPFSEKVVLRKVKTETQTNKSKLDRWKNVSDVFVVIGEGQISRKHILLVDDVITTGATIEACAQVLLDHGAANISIACIAVA
jgi:ComF family protein